MNQYLLPSKVDNVELRMPVSFSRYSGAYTTTSSVPLTFTPVLDRKLFTNCSQSI